MLRIYPREKDEMRVELYGCVYSKGKSVGLWVHIRVVWWVGRFVHSLITRRQAPVGGWVGGTLTKLWL